MITIPFNSAPSEQHAKKTLLLEDDTIVAEFLWAYLTACGHSVVHVSSGVEGIREIVKSDFDLIICDLMMPKLPGNMFYLAVERSKPHLCHKFIFITGNASTPQMREFISKTSGLLLLKPFRVEALAAAIQQVDENTPIG